ncbi:hypothetical protein COW36_11070 [bacterium (Candidatus Blackallbacteria) CG17_big_fil_post_rev_8_21_14_2_50_48_46]|uniref:Uncharacterized protein n=1 Tax=bacterium (Candidatus Blackallbacteria) CG17_big_fil_post_rev_8_21_14_2_50_48_46 TaxID=2014261 RepID=A0A2M7G4H7_9BACT|nr:MAG: hypothetical protein COW64_18165 [bacterium (Candidatus Blackallbacteria) CG18_big_fil_WC_8_21_14_2_50_49_26]PIW16816.1 MAG: hypothetical protein COW36_11070 [bacterium (Candidatus Blackallbacteria) CG17_big_fil_post_rev_8_21_14_2_50_48_46]PIW48013.1 MAG: hypothetical protein COW20_10785 [bacterium (Candidatus Blackallbacteria) CG13_big_fil_rev_8_21_14_2_50_49_14]
MIKFLLITLTIIQLGLVLPTQAAELPSNSPQIIEHLGYLGYKSSKETSSSDNPYIAVSHEKEWNFIVLKSGGGVSLIMGFDIKPESLKKRDELLNLINDINSTSVWLPQVYIYKSSNGTESFKFQAWMPDTYDKESFASFMQRWQEDTNAAAQRLKEHLSFE